MATITVPQAANVNIPVWLDVLAWCEGTSAAPYTKNDGYDVIVRGVDMQDRLLPPEVFTDYSTHPFAGSPQRPANLIVPPGTRFANGLRSSASGRYQIILPTWRGLCPLVEKEDFSPLTQDLMAIQILRSCGAMAAIAAGDIAAVCALIHEQWASIPGSEAGQGGKSLADVTAKWNELRATVQGGN